MKKTIQTIVEEEYGEENTYDSYYTFDYGESNCPIIDEEVIIIGMGIRSDSGGTIFNS